MHWSMDMQAWVVFTGRMAGLAEGLLALNSCRLS